MQYRKGWGMKSKGLVPARRFVEAVLCVIGLCTSDAALAQLSPAAQRGLTFVRVHCAECHSIDRVNDSPLTIAPPLRTLHLRYPMESLRQRLSEGITASHPTMPQFRLDPDQTSDVIAYLQSLQ
jgi:mono/diheme cytochrome c family protein